MNYYIYKEPNKMGNHGPIFTTPLGNKTVKLPYEFFDLYLQYKGYVILTFNDIGEIVRVDPNEEEFNGYEQIASQLEQVSSYEEERHQLEDTLASEDYKIIKCMEALLSQTSMPYDYSSLIEKRNKYRDRITELDSFISKKDEYLLAMKEFGDKHPDKKPTVVFAPEK